MPVSDVWKMSRNRPRGQSSNGLQPSAEVKAGYTCFLAKKFRTAGFRVIIRVIIDEKSLYDAKRLQLDVNKTIYFFLAA